jgi:hypothetical protein
MRSRARETGGTRGEQGSHLYGPRGSSSDLRMLVWLQEEHALPAFLSPSPLLSIPAPLAPPVLHPGTTLCRKLSEAHSTADGAPRSPPKLLLLLLARFCHGLWKDTLRKGMVQLARLYPPSIAGNEALVGSGAELSRCGWACAGGKGWGMYIHKWDVGAQDTWHPINQEIHAVWAPAGSCTALQHCCCKHSWMLTAIRCARRFGKACIAWIGRTRAIRGAQALCAPC